MRRRNFLVLGSATAVWPLVAHAQQPTRPVTIGFLDPNSPTAQAQQNAALVLRLRQLGWIEGQNLTIEYRWTDGRVERSAELADELVRLKVDIIVAAGTEVAVAAKR